MGIYNRVLKDDEFVTRYRQREAEQAKKNSE